MKYAAQFEMDMDEVKEAYEDDPSYLLEQGINNLDEFYYDWITDDMTNEIMMHCYFDLGMDVSSSYDVVFRNGIETVDIKDLDKPHAFALSYTGDACTAYEAMRMADYFVGKSNSEQIDYARFASFMDYLLGYHDAFDMPNWDDAYSDSEPFDWQEMEIYVDCSDDQHDLFEARLDEDEERRESWYYSGNLNEDSDVSENENNWNDDFWDFMPEEDEY
ncbi:MAG: hypothetical protein Q4C20_11660 [Erysipelotrichaceae bacterium]|nr:hypothetical protein [Erysipelotrichaceae bacterium]